AGAQFYKVYKGLSSGGAMVPPQGQPLGFAGYAYGTSMTDANIVPDFTKTPLPPKHPFDPGQVTGYSISAPGTGYPVAGTTLSVSGGGAPTRPATVVPVLNTNVAGATGGIVGIIIIDGGAGYSSAPSVTAAGGGGSGFAATLSIGPTSGTNPDV